MANNFLSPELSRPHGFRLQSDVVDTRTNVLHLRAETRQGQKAGGSLNALSLLEACIFVLRTYSSSWASSGQPSSYRFPPAHALKFFWFIGFVLPARPEVQEPPGESNCLCSRLHNKQVGNTVGAEEYTILGKPPLVAKLHQHPLGATQMPTIGSRLHCIEGGGMPHLYCFRLAPGAACHSPPKPCQRGCSPACFPHRGVWTS